MVSYDHRIISHSSITSSNFHFGIFWQLNYQSFFDYVFWFPLWYLFTIVLLVILWLHLLISPLVSFGHCIVSHSLITSSNFPFWYLLAIVLSVILWLRLLISTFGIFWPLNYQSFFDYVFWYPLWYLLTIVLLVILRLRLLISPLVSFDHWIISHSSIMSSDFPFGIFWPLYY